MYNIIRFCVLHGCGTCMWVYTLGIGVIFISIIVIIIISSYMMSFFIYCFAGNK